VLNKVHIIILFLVSLLIVSFNLHEIITLFNSILDSIFNLSTILSSGLQGEGGNAFNSSDPTPGSNQVNGVSSPGQAPGSNEVNGHNSPGSNEQNDQDNEGDPDDDEEHDCPCGHATPGNCSCDHEHTRNLEEEGLQLVGNHRCCECGQRDPEAHCCSCGCVFHENCLQNI
jgi:hypothetical protein